MWLPDVAPRADVDTLERLVQDKHAAGLHQPAGDHDLLLVAARERADPVGSPWQTTPICSIIWP